MFVIRYLDKTYITIVQCMILKDDIPVLKNNEFLNPID